MKCPYPDCTGQVSPGEQFCGECGRSLDPAAIAAALGTTATAPLTQPFPPAENQARVEAPPQPRQGLPPAVFPAQVVPPPVPTPTPATAPPPPPAPTRGSNT